MKLKMVIVALMALGLIIAPAHAKKGKNKSLPPGLQKKVERGKSLPPGWQKKLSKGQVVDREVYAGGKVIVPLDPLGIVTIKIDDKILRVMEKSRRIVDILHE
ncbi:MAG: hypothetical protein KAS94_05400 [Desulfobulbaceae bacterium]|nr:hypothetical protein [Desulfobulbaceae bacterium]